MRIGLLLYGDINTLSGGYLYDRKLVEICRQHNDEVIIVSLQEKAYIKALTVNKVPPELLGLGLDVLIQDELVHPAFFRINSKLKELLKCPVVSLVHLLKSSIPAAWYKKMVFRMVEKLYLGSVDALIFNSEHTKYQAGELCNSGLPESITALPCGDNFGNIEAVRKTYTDKELNILFVGNISRQKGLHTLLEALKVLNDSGITLSIAGRLDIDNAYVNSQLKFINDNDLDKQIRFLGPVTGAVLAKLYQEHELFVLPSENEAYGIVYLEAMQFYMPVIATNAGGASELVENHKNGYLITPGDSYELAKLIRLLNSDKQLLAELSENARQKYQNHVHWDETVRKIRQFLQKLVNDKGVPD